LGWVSVIAGYGLALLFIRGIFIGITRGFGATRSQAFWIVLGYLLFLALAVYLFTVGRRALSIAKGSPKPRVRFGWGRMLAGAIFLYGSAVDNFHLIPARGLKHLEAANETQAVAMKGTAIVIALGCIGLILSGLWRGFRPRAPRPRSFEQNPRPAPNFRHPDPLIFPVFRVPLFLCCGVGFGTNRDQGDCGHRQELQVAGRCMAATRHLPSIGNNPMRKIRLSFIALLVAVPVAFGQLQDSPNYSSLGNHNVRIAAVIAPDGTPYQEDSPSVAVNPRSRNHIVAVSLRTVFSTQVSQCVTYRSIDHGETWGTGIAVKQLNKGVCDHPSLAYSPDGSRLYLAYDNSVSINYSSENDKVFYTFLKQDVLVSHSDDDGLTWSDPVIALNAEATYYYVDYATGTQRGQDGFQYDWPRIATSAFDPTQADYVYLSATKSDRLNQPVEIDFTRSVNRAHTFAAPVLIDAGYDSDEKPIIPSIVVEGSRPASGFGTGVLLAWYNSGLGGPQQPQLEIHTAYSPDSGKSFDPVVIASAENFGLPLWLPPYVDYHAYQAWWEAMFPSISMDGMGVAHIAYTYSPVDFSGGVEPSPPWTGSVAGDIRYITAGAPYTNWSQPVTVNDDGSAKAHGYPAIAANEDGSVQLIWEDHRLSPVDNLKFDIFTAGKKAGQLEFSPNERLTKRSSFSVWSFLGEYNDLAWDGERWFAIWTDRRDATGFTDQNSDIYGSAITSKEFQRGRSGSE
jgi:hypothetical protein